MKQFELQFELRQASIYYELLDTIIRLKNDTNDELCGQDEKCRNCIYRKGSDWFRGKVEDETT